MLLTDKFRFYDRTEGGNVATEDAHVEYEMMNGWNVLLIQKGDITGAVWSDFDFYYEAVAFIYGRTGNRLFPAKLRK